MMDQVNQEDWLDRQLREAAPYIDDDGFTARVLQKLPQPQRRHQSLRAIILFGITLLASALAYVVSDGGRFIAVAMGRVMTLPVMWVFVLSLATGLVMTALSFIAAISRTREFPS